MVEEGVGGAGREVVAPLDARLQMEAGESLRIEFDHVCNP